jgi:predicted ATPase
VLQLRRLTIENYKALGHVDIQFDDKLLFLIGVNGAGKSSILQALSLVRYFAKGSTSAFFRDRGWKSLDARPKTSSVSPLRAAANRDGTRRLPARSLGIALALEHFGNTVLWSFRWDYRSEQAVEENVWVSGPQDRMPRKILSFPTTVGDEGPLAALSILGRLNLPGSVLSLVRSDTLGASQRDTMLLRELRAWADGITSLELLNPSTMRNQLRGEGSDIGQQGGRLTSFLAALSSEAKDRVVRRMSHFYPIRDLDTTRKRTGWIDMRIAESFKLIGRIDVSHMSDGFLRILALCSIPEFEDDSLVLIDEVEDGIEPHILPQLIERVAAEAPSQLVMTSHSPLLVNYFEQRQIYLLARDRSGHTVGASAASLPLFQEAEGYLGTGEIWANAAGGSIYDALPQFRAPRRSIGDDPSPLEVRRYLQG